MSDTIKVDQGDVSREYVDEEITWMELNGAAVGSIEAGPDQQGRLDEITERIGRGEFHKKIKWTHKLKMLIARCVDGRTPEAGANPLAPNAAGGTETLFVADDLTTKRYASEDGTTLSGYQNMVGALTNEGYVVGGHTDEHADDEKSGCGANDKLMPIYQYIAQNSDLLRGLTEEKFGYIVSDETHAMITGNATTRNQFSKGSQLLAALKANAEAEFVDRLHGKHSEVITVINKRQGTTLDRDALAAEFGSEYEAFNVDEWAFDEAARVTSITPEEVQQKKVAMAYYNLATALVLAGPKMRELELN